MTYNIPDHKSVKQLSVSELEELATSISKFLIENVSKTGGHIGANLGVIELTIALHYVFDSPKDKIIFDTGHAGYTHKLLTGRAHLFPTLNKFGGMNRFLARSESEHDHIDATHAGTSLSIAAGMAKAFQLDGISDNVIAVIGDGSLVEGMAFEALNFISGTRLRLIIVVNDNGMAIAPNVGGIRNLTSGPNWQTKCKAFFEGLGLSYLSVPDGHDISSLISALQKAKDCDHPIVVHIKTEKGRGLPYAKDHPYKMHFSMPFNPENGEGSSPTIQGITYANVAAEELLCQLRSDEDIVVITPATPYASYLDGCLREFPERVFDVGMAEQHAVTMACGLALTGKKKPVVCFQTTFMQRAFDQLIHDAAFMNLPVTFLGVRSGFAGYDGPTHHGLYDLPYLRSLPNMQVVYPTDTRDLRRAIAKRLASPSGPMVILYPYDVVPTPEPEAGTREDELSVIHLGTDGIILCIGNRLFAAHEIRKSLKTKFDADFGIVCINNIKPFPIARVMELCDSVKRVVTLEESTLPGGFGSQVCEVASDHSLNLSILRSGVKDEFVPAGSKEECSRVCNIDTEHVVDQIRRRWPELAK